MSLTQSEVRKDAELIFKSVQDDASHMPSALQALKISSLFPLACLASYALSMVWIVISFSPPDDMWINPIIHYLGGVLAFGAFTVILTLVLIATFYGPSLVYLAIPEKVRDSSAILLKIKRLSRNFGGVLTFVNFLYAVVCAFYPSAFYGAPFLLLMSYIVFQLVINAELVRYGIAPLMEKISSLLKKI
ncbi:hypothetical protein ACQPT2_21280 [Erwinia amylovora]